MIVCKTLEVCLTTNLVCVSTFILILCVGDSMLLISNGISTAICTDRLSLTPWRKEGGWREGGWRRMEEGG